jgi:predicted acyltransferase
LNLFPRESPFLFNEGAWSTLSFIPTLGTMILGLLAGGVLRDERRSPRDRVRWLVVAGVVGLVSAWLLNALGICPLVKRIWTSSFTLWTGGLCLLILAFAYQVIDVMGKKRWAFPLVVIGMNSIAAYCLHELVVPFTQQILLTHLGPGLFRSLGDAYYPLLLGAAGFVVFWLILLWMYKRRIFLRI